MVKTGELVDKKLAELLPLIPVVGTGKPLPRKRHCQRSEQRIYYQPDRVYPDRNRHHHAGNGSARRRINRFFTDIFHWRHTAHHVVFGRRTERTSLAGFIIAMGMLVDNAIVVTDNAQIGIKRGKSRYLSLIEGAIKPQWALLGATFIAICSFLPLYLAPASVAEIVKPLFIVLAVSLGLSWILLYARLQLSVTLFCKRLLPVVKVRIHTIPKFNHKFEKLLTLLIKRRFITLTTVVVTLVLSLVIMQLCLRVSFRR